MAETKQFTVLVTGSRNLSSQEDRGFVLASLREIQKTLPDHDFTLIHGAAKGADMVAATFARQLGWRVIGVPANWGKYGKQAGPVRNRLMLDDYKPDMVVAFPMGESRGTRGCMAEARKRGIHVWEPRSITAMNAIRGIL